MLCRRYATLCSAAALRSKLCQCIPVLCLACALPRITSLFRCKSRPCTASPSRCVVSPGRAMPLHVSARLCFAVSVQCCSLLLFAAALPLNANRCYSQAFHINAFAEHLQSMPLQCVSKQCHCKASLGRALALSCRTLLRRYFSVQGITAPMRNISAPCHSVAFPRTSSPLLLHAYHSRCFPTHIVAVALHRTAFSLPRPT